MENGINYAKAFEKHGANFYIELGMKADNLITKKLFYTLAKQEIEHLETIENFILTGNYVIIENLKIERELREFFEKLEEKTKVETHLQGYETALELEKKSYNHYKTLYDNADNEKEKILYEFLMKQEKEHIEAIVNVYTYLSETENWFQREESKVWNWMNL